ncbi:hypothetical protein K0M31_015086, partial [Melipona bicolor]
IINWPTLVVKAARQKQVTRACLLLYEFKLGLSKDLYGVWGRMWRRKGTARNWFQKFATGEESLEDALPNPEHHFP